MSSLAQWQRHSTLNQATDKKIGGRVDSTQPANEKLGQRQAPTSAEMPVYTLAKRRLKRSRGFLSVLSPFSGQ